MEESFIRDIIRGIRSTSRFRLEGDSVTFGPEWKAEASKRLLSLWLSGIGWNLYPAHPEEKDRFACLFILFVFGPQPDSLGMLPLSHPFSNPGRKLGERETEESSVLPPKSCLSCMRIPCLFGVRAACALCALVLFCFLLTYFTYVLSSAWKSALIIFCLSSVPIPE